MPFSRATASATCSISSRGRSAVVVAIFLRSSLSSSNSNPRSGLALGQAPRFGEQGIRQDQLGTLHQAQRQTGLAALFQTHHNILAIQPQQHALETTAAVQRLAGLDTRDVAGPTHIILWSRQWPVDPGRG